MSIAFIGLGANLGDPAATLQRALRDLVQIPGLRVVQCSRSYRSRAVGLASQPDYVNAVAKIDTALTPPALLDHLLAIESRHGRVRGGERWGPRTLDLDLLLYDQLQFRDARLTLPHPEICNRNFVLAPLLELAPEITIPGVGPARHVLEKLGSEGLWLLDVEAAAVDSRTVLDEE
ncbi:MAG: 2-amino-4-hydroxy-6-hydroxymethyldihydropteridine diphosphokinase [Gammaproteobacteria bacterium]|nr:2-amino-4-hydroxy-6-hydroxymethyldihydropteridine diphosphokinase [Gammaproteobacteria bacterium]